MVDTVDSREEHSGVNPISSMGDGGTSISREEFSVALDTLITSMTTKVESMFNKFWEGLKLSTAPMKVGDPANKVTDANSDKGGLLVTKFLYLVVEVEMASLPMWNLHLVMEYRFPPLI
mgnify:CR=1 FL=1